MKMGRAYSLKPCVFVPMAAGQLFCAGQLFLTACKPQAPCRDRGCFRFNIYKISPVARAWSFSQRNGFVSEPLRGVKDPWQLPPHDGIKGLVMSITWFAMTSPRDKEIGERDRYPDNIQEYLLEGVLPFYSEDGQGWTKPQIPSDVQKYLKPNWIPFLCHGWQENCGNIVNIIIYCGTIIRMFCLQ